MVVRSFEEMLYEESDSDSVDEEEGKDTGSTTICFDSVSVDSALPLGETTKDHQIVSSHDVETPKFLSRDTPTMGDVDDSTHDRWFPNQKITVERIDC